MFDSSSLFISPIVSRSLFSLLQISFVSCICIIYNYKPSLLMLKTKLVFLPGNSRSSKGWTGKVKPHQQLTDRTRRYLTLVLVPPGPVIYPATPPGPRVPMQRKLYKNTPWTSSLCKKKQWCRTLTGWVKVDLSRLFLEQALLQRHLHLLHHQRMAIVQHLLGTISHIHLKLIKKQHPYQLSAELQPPPVEVDLGRVNPSPNQTTKQTQVWTSQ